MATAQPYSIPWGMMAIEKSFELLLSFLICKWKCQEYFLQGLLWDSKKWMLQNAERAWCRALRKCWGTSGTARQHTPTHANTCQQHTLATCETHLRCAQCFRLDLCPLAIWDYALWVRLLVSPPLPSAGVSSFHSLSSLPDLHLVMSPSDQGREISLLKQQGLPPKHTHGILRY